MKNVTYNEKVKMEKDNLFNIFGNPNIAEKLANKNNVWMKNCENSLNLKRKMTKLFMAKNSSKC